MILDSLRSVITFRDGWKFTREAAAGMEAADFDDTAWQDVRVPHDWAIAGPFDRENDLQITAIFEDGQIKEGEHTGRTGGLPHVGKGWYRLRFDLPEDIASRRVRIEFDGVMSHSRVYCNGEFVGSWPYGYTSFAFDITALVKPGENILAVSCDNKPHASRWYPGAGIFRHVRLVTLAPVHVGHWGTFVTTPSVGKNSATVHVRTEISCGLPRESNVELETVLLDPEGKQIAAIKESRRIAADAVFEQQADVPSPALWSIETPRLYTARSVLRVEGEVVDVYETLFGIRTLEFNPLKGFFLNGQRVRLNGVCMHHDLGALGAAVNRAALARQLRILKDMGCNAIRTSHNPPAPELLELTDGMGFVVIDEAFDEWHTGKCDNGCHILFDEWGERDLRALIRRDRNHPSVIMWSLGNEIREQTDSERGREICKFLHDITHGEDPTRPTTCGFNCADEAIANGLAEVVDVPGWNYRPYAYARYHAEHPEWPMYGSETASCISSRGEYYFPVEDEKHPVRENLQVNSYDLSSPNWASCPDVEFRGVDENPWIMGEFVWTGFDYLGEPTPYYRQWPSRSSYFGIVDLCGLPKDRFYLYRSRWSSEPTLHILPHWTWPGREGEITPVHCFSSWDTVELFLNGVSQGKRSKDIKNLLSKYRIVWNGVKYEPGELKAVAYDADGKPVAETAVRTAGAPAAVRLTPDSGAMAANGLDMAFVTVEIVDADGNLCPRADNLVRFAVEGPAEIAAVDNGNAATVEPFIADYRKAFNGKCVVYLRSVAGRTGTVRLKAESEGLTSGNTHWEAQPPEE